MQLKTDMSAEAKAVSMATTSGSSLSGEGDSPPTSSLRLSGGGGDGEAGGGASGGGGSISELKRAFELVEVTSPGISDQLISRILVHLQRRCECDILISEVSSLF